MLLAALALLMLTACGEEAAEQGRPGREAVPVRTARVQAADFRETAEGIGSLESPETVEVSPEIGARIERVHFREGERVEKGALLFSLDSAKLRSELQGELASLESAEASLDEARASYKRFEKLFETGTVSEEEYEQRLTAFRNAKAEAARLEARVELMRERLDETTIRAAMSGVLSERLVDPGDYAGAGDTLVTLYKLDPLEISFRVAETFMGRVRRGQRVMVHISSGAAGPHEGEVVFVGPRVDPDTRRFLVKASVGNADGELKPGSFARAVLVLDVREGRPSVPERALVSARTGYSVFVIRDGKAVRRKVKIGLRRPGVVEILEGVETGEQVVVGGQMRLSDGAGVVIEKGEGGAGGEKQ